MGEYRHRLKNSRFQMICQVFQNFFADFLYYCPGTGIFFAAISQYRLRDVARQPKRYAADTIRVPAAHRFTITPEVILRSYCFRE